MTSPSPDARLLAAAKAEPGFLTHPTHFLFFTGKGGVGKTSLSTATALALAERFPARGTDPGSARGCGAVRRG